MGCGGGAVGGQPRWWTRQHHTFLSAAQVSSGSTARDPLRVLVLWKAESVAELAVELAEVLEMVWVDLWEPARGALCCSLFPSSSNRTPAGPETKRSPTVRSPMRSRMVAMSLPHTTATEEVGSGTTSSEDSTS